MDFKKYKELVKQIKTGKQLPDAVYLHNNALGVIPPALAQIMREHHRHDDE